MTMFKDALIEEVRKHPLLWDTSLKENKDINAKEKAWIEIGQNFGKQASECKNAFELLRQQFSKEKRKCKPSEDGTDYVYHGSWSFFDSLSFLYPFIIPRKYCTNLLHNEKTFKQGLSHTSAIQQYQDEDDMFDSVDYSLKLEPGQWVGTSAERHCEYEPPTKVMRTRVDIVPRISNVGTQSYHEVYPKQESSEDEYDRFGRMMTKLIKKIEPESRRLSLIVDINALIYAALASDDNPNINS